MTHVTGQANGVLVLVAPILGKGVALQVPEKVRISWKGGWKSTHHGLPYVD